MATTAIRLIKRSLRKISALGSGQELPAEDASDALEELNSMLSSWSADSMLIYANNRIEFPLVAGVGEYTIGSGLDIDTPRPEKITAAFVRQSDDTDFHIDIVDDKQYSRYVNKDDLGLVEALYYDGNYPSAKIYLFPYPFDALSLHMSLRQPLTEFATLQTVVDLPSGYEDAIVFNLATRLAPEYEKEPSQQLLRDAVSSMAIVKSSVRRHADRYMRTDPILNQGGGVSGNINSGYNN